MINFIGPCAILYYIGGTISRASSNDSIINSSLPPRHPPSPLPLYSADPNLSEKSQKVAYLPTFLLIYNTINQKNERLRKGIRKG